MSNADAIIAALRSGFDSLAGQVSGLSDTELAGPTGAAEWDVSQVLSHLGSGAEIHKNLLRAALAGKPGPGQEFNQAVWDRYDAMSRRERLEGFLAANEDLTSFTESLDEATRESLKVDLGFLPAPVDLAAALATRLNELALHSWDVRVSSDPAAALAPEATPHLLPMAGLLAGFLGRADALDGTTAVIAVTTAGPAGAFGLHLTQPVSVSQEGPERADGTLALPAESWVRLLTGRLGAAHTPAGITTTGAADLDLLRRVFPKF
jgi:uncharacterized protein (TIGR03083 family)